MLLDRDCEALHLGSVLACMVSAISLVSSQFPVRMFLVFSWVGSSLPLQDSISVPLSLFARFAFIDARETLGNVVVGTDRAGELSCIPSLASEHGSCMPVLSARRRLKVGLYFR